MNTQRKGQSLVEFALVALVLYLLLGAIFTFGHALYVAQQVQMSADLLAREVSRTPLSVNGENLREAMQDQAVKSSIYDESKLRFNLLDLEDPDSPEDLREEIKTWPIVNRMLSVVMTKVDGFFQYPGIVNHGTTDDPHYRIATSYEAALPTPGNPVDEGWVDVVEELTDSAENSLYPPGSDSGGVVALRINYPVHSPFFTAMHPLPEEAKFGDPNANYVKVSPGDNASEITSEFGEYRPEYLNPEKELYGGNRGLGRQYAWGTQVRPYRRIVSGQAIYRREVFTH
ncbi:hypothetical protein C5Y96_17260 [Blastopirellula marina]|uniref:TadE-like domain-containing protein n=1 Tax=Blastopirellula marina TaxID=124 RepID=A0A2S8F543_9BACT|nr:MULTISPECIES: TadE/TadG family type IV pilus assembly protein [Pirellulaceae]PQO27292.1 hypothetical protein C5Y96_17260 [Blastopirellula marina]RCS47829.1 hypothetical protein DTL36_17285 [Bremerella cremea]